ncbi:MAG TPA: DoxX family protein [Acidobacteriaceae bacterium]|jgi:putative oxidoreductase|nr:DoxX family protein [Acidobacteriaceae bacterium]
MNATAAGSAQEKPSGLISSLYRRFQHGSAALESPFLLLVRLYWGWQFAQTGWGKLNHLAHVTQFFSSLGIPLPGFNAAFVSGLEFVGGILLILGIGTRFVGLLLAVDMIVAYITTDLSALASILSDPDKFYSDAAYTFLIASLIVMIFGAGRFSLDYLIWRRCDC